MKHLIQRVLSIKLISTQAVILFIGLLIIGHQSMAKTYHYSAELGSPVAYSVLFDLNQNYFTDKNGEPLLHMVFWGGPPAMSWARGRQATSLSEYNPLPYGVKVRWFSVAENQFWEGEYQFDQQFLAHLSTYRVNNILYRTNKAFMDYFRLLVYVVPGGLATVWISGEGEQYLLGQFQAHKVEEPDWETFSKKALQLRGEFTREEYLKEMLNSKAMADTKKALDAGQIPTSDDWRSLMTRYFWRATINSPFVLTDDSTRYLNGEKFFSYEHTNPLAKARAVPYHSKIFFKDKQQKLRRLDLDFDKEEIKTQFAKVAAQPPLNEAINLHFEIREDLKEIRVFLMKGDIKVELHKIRARHQKQLYLGLAKESQE